MQRLRSILGAANPPLEARHQPSGLNTWFNGGQLAFSEYVAHNRNMLIRAHSALGAVNPGEVVDGNAPFELKPAAGSPAGHAKTYRRGVLLTHGLTNSPYFMRHMAATGWPRKLMRSIWRGTPPALR